jgi:hypothetical protein
MEPMPDRETSAAGRDIDPKLLEILVCPVTKTTLEYDRERQELISRAARLAFPIRDASRSSWRRRRGGWRTRLAPEAEGGQRRVSAHADATDGGRASLRSPL